MTSPTLRAFEIQWGQSDLESGSTTSIVVAATALDALPSRVLVLRRSSPYPGQVGTMAVSTSRDSLARFISEADRGSFLENDLRELWEVHDEQSPPDTKTGRRYPVYCCLDEAETL